MPVTKEGAKVLMQDYADLKKNPPKIEKSKTKSGHDLFNVMMYSNVSKGYIPVGEYTKQKTARADLKIFIKDHKETLDKVLRLSKNVVDESTETVVEGFKEGDKIKISNPKHNDRLDGAEGIVRQHLGSEVTIDFPKPIVGDRGVKITFTTRPAKQISLVKEGTITELTKYPQHSIVMIDNSKDDLDGEMAIVIKQTGNKVELELPDNKSKRISRNADDLELVENEILNEDLALLGIVLGGTVGLLGTTAAAMYVLGKIGNYVEKGSAKKDIQRIFNSKASHKTAMEMLSKNKRTKRFMLKSKDMAKKSPAEIKKFKDEFMETVKEEFDKTDLRVIMTALKSMGQKVKISIEEGIDPVAILRSTLHEGKKDFETYHQSYTSATQEVITYVEKNGYSIDYDDVWAQSVTFGRGKPSEGKTIRHKIPLLKNGKETKKYVNFQVYGLGNPNNNRALNNYELNLYIS